MLIVKHFHESTSHQGKGMTLNAIRSNGFWVVSGSSTVASAISSCVKCQKLRGAVQEQKTSDLPEDRLESTPPFTYRAVDYFGPFIVKDGRKELKLYTSKQPTPSRQTHSSTLFGDLSVVEVQSVSLGVTREQTLWGLVRNSPRP